MGDKKNGIQTQKSDDTSIHPHSLETIADFNSVMIKIRNVRRKVVNRMLSDQPFAESTLVSLKNARDALEQDIDGFQRNFCHGEKMDGDDFAFNIKDEVIGVRKDITFLTFFTEETLGDWDEFIDYLAQFHPVDKDTFFSEMAEVLKLFGRLSEGIDVLLTDWDGTMKSYGSNYITCMQPAYSALVLAKFAKRYTHFAAVLTAGPLRDHGILDLTAVPYDGDWLHFGGSWGREWLLSGTSITDESCFTESTRAALLHLTKEIDILLDSSEFKQFRFIGSGFQKKVDRITLGFQNVSNDIDPAVCKQYWSAVRQCRLNVDPKEEMFVQLDHEMDTEIVLKQAQSKAWDKAMGSQFILNHLKIDPSLGNILVMGDTMSDVPMVRFAASVNTKTHAIFVNSTENVKDKINGLLAKERICFVGCPDVIHAAMAKFVLKSKRDHTC